MLPKKLLFKTINAHKKMWMEVHIYSVKAKSQTGNIRVKGIMTTQKGQSWKKVLRVLLGLYIYISEYTWKVAASAH